MSKIFLYIFFIYSIFSFGQNENLNQIYVDWENPKNFEKYNVKKVTVYSKEIKKNGKIKRDSLLLAKYEYDKSKDMIKGINHYLIVMFHRGESQLKFYNFKNQYFSDSLIVKKENKEIPKVTKDKIVNNSFVELYKYDNLNRLISDKKYSEENEYNLSKKDTTAHYRSISYPKTTEYEYDFKSRLIKQYITRDSSEYYINLKNYNSISESKNCSYCEEKYLDQERKYDDSNLLEWTTYTYKKEKHTKRNYFYDENQNLGKQIDSTGWYLGKPSLSSIKEIRYDDNIKIEIQTNFNDDSYFKKETKKFDNNQLVYELLEAKYPEYNVETTLTYSRNSIKKTTNRFKNGITVEEYLFNKNGLLIEQKTYLSEILIEYKKYYYE
ncbi:hypothetical protein [Flavobacterium tibetense]|uniref:Uncharacterized protein n=1 Tax=Flavobacterium tibetense TaxID=2233533 RepID=A0A365P5T6_9FLAO|nr:hypothetical protein [Flavobacterium tibetense]RBA29787.1 hypothetical protein DPN68_00720 [Flavobacterium tibetense]